MFKAIMAITVILISIGSGWGEQKLIISIKPGKNYNTIRNMGFLKIIMIPQMAVWLEDGNGKFVANIFVTHKSAKSDWFGGDKIRRPDALPVWSHRMGVQYSDGLYMPDKKHPLPDAVTGATPKAAYTIDWKVPADLPAGKYNLYAEVNNAFDYNSAYREKLPQTNLYYNAYNGQPSVVYKSGITFVSNLSGLKLSLTGHGEVLGRGGSISTNLAEVKEAAQMIDSITVSIESK